jgi:hypothetical protein
VLLQAAGVIESTPSLSPKSSSDVVGKLRFFEGRQDRQRAAGPVATLKESFQYSERFACAGRNDTYFVASFGKIKPRTVNSDRKAIEILCITAHRRLHGDVRGAPSAHRDSQAT